MKAAIFHCSRHLGLGDIYDATAQCPVCGSEESRNQVHTLQRDPFVYLLRCGKCHAYSASHIPMQKTLDEYYRSYYDADSGRESVTFHDVNRFGRHLRRWIGHKVCSDQQRPLRLCDIGGGDGSLAFATARAFGCPCEIDVVDYPVAGLASTDLVRIRYFNKIEDVTGEYDCVIASAVLEHMPQLRETLPRILRLVRPRGYFYARTPYAVPFLKVLPRWDFTYPAHIHDLGPRFWSHVLDTYDISGEVVVSQPAIVETTFRFAFLRTLLSKTLKLPAKMEQFILRDPRRVPFWKFVGGWESILRLDLTSSGEAG